MTIASVTRQSSAGNPARFHHATSVRKSQGLGLAAGGIVFFRLSKDTSRTGCCRQMICFGPKGHYAVARGNAREKKLTVAARSIGVLQGSPVIRRSPREVVSVKFSPPLIVRSSQRNGNPGGAPRR